MDLTKGMLLFSGGLAGIVVSIVFIICFVCLQKRAKKKLMRRLDGIYHGGES